MLKDDLKTGMLAAMKAGKAVEKNILRLALGEIQTAESRTAETVADAEVERMLRKLIKSIGESLAATADETQRAGLEEEIAVLERYLPQTLSVDEIVTALAPVQEALLAAGNDGQATGVAMKHLKAQGAVVEGKDVSAAVRSLRSA
jgi:uncharacterized protein YqeY